MPGAWRFMISSKTGWSGVSIGYKSLDDVASLICDSRLSVAARAMSRSVSDMRNKAGCWDFKQPTNNKSIAALCWRHLC